MAEAVLQGASRSYRLDCASQAAMVRLEEATGLVYLDVLAALQAEPADETLMSHFLDACLVDAGPVEARAVLEDIGGPGVIAAAAAAVAARG